MSAASPTLTERKRLADVLDDAIRVTAPGGHISPTSECCDFDRSPFDPAAISDPDRWSNRGPYFSGFTLLARKRAS